MNILYSCATRNGVLSQRRKVFSLPYNRFFRRHVPDMSLEQDYEKHGNPGSHSKDPSQGSNDSQQKQRPKSSHSAFEHEDAVLSEKKDRPPRFSTVFANPTPPVPYRDDDPPRERKRSGVYVPMPLFILFAALLLLMSTFLFAYTIIGLYNNRPAGLLSQPSPINGCDCAGIKFAPNFLLCNDAKTTVTVTAGAAVLPQAQTEIKKSPSPSSTKLVVVTPKPIVVSSTVIIAVNQNGKTITPSSSKSTSTSKSKSTEGGKDAQKVKKDTTAVVPASTHEKQSTATSAKTTSKTTKKDKDKITTSTTRAKDAKGTDACANQIDNGGSPHLILNCAR